MICKVQIYPINSLFAEFVNNFHTSQSWWFDSRFKTGISSLANFNLTFSSEHLIANFHFLAQTVNIEFRKFWQFFASIMGRSFAIKTAKFCLFTFSNKIVQSFFADAWYIFSKLLLTVMRWIEYNLKFYRIYHIVHRNPSFLCTAKFRRFQNNYPWLMLILDMGLKEWEEEPYVV